MGFFHPVAVFHFLEIGFREILKHASVVIVVIALVEVSIVQVSIVQNPSSGYDPHKD